MAEPRARVRINLTTREVEVEGDEPFVALWAERLGGLLDLMTESGPPPAEALTQTSAEGAAGAEPEPFGAFVQHLPSSATEVDRMLAAGFWLQRQAQDDAFATGEASRLLSEHGHKIGNPSQAVRQSAMAKRVFMVQRGRWRVSQGGRGYLGQTMGRPLPS